MSTKKPPPISDGPLKAYARRPPTATDPRWYWQVVHHEGGGQHPVAGASGRHTPAEIRALLRARLAAGDWRSKPEAAPVVEQTWGTLLQLFTDHAESRVERGRMRPATLASYRHRKTLVTRYLGARPISAPLDLASAEELIEELEDHGLAPLTVRLIWSWVVSAIRWGHQRGYLPPGTIPQPELPAPNRLRDRVTPSYDEARRVIEALDDDWRRVAGRILMGTGCRPGELGEVRWEDWRPEAGEAGVLHLDGKTGPRQVWVGAETAQTIREWWERQGRPETGTLLGIAPTTMPSMSFTYLPEACERAGVSPSWGAYGLRRLASTRLIASRIDPAAYEAQMGHSYQMALSTYTSTVASSRAEAAAALDAPAEGTTGQVIRLDAARGRRA